MGIDSFESDSDTVEAKVERPNIDTSDCEKVRPYVSSAVHQKVNLFSANAGMSMQKTYDTILNKCVTNTDILELVLTKDKDYSDSLTEIEQRLLLELVNKSNELGSFPTRMEINSDKELSGFPIYITYLGKRKRIKRLIKDKYSDELNISIE